MNMESSTPTPTVGRIVHYVSYGTPGGEYGKECRAAIVTQVSEEDSSVVGLAVLNPTGLFFNSEIGFDAGGETPGDPGCPSEASHGDPFRYCQCGWSEASLKGGTWHWPERA